MLSVTEFIWGKEKNSSKKWKITSHLMELLRKFLWNRTSFQSMCHNSFEMEVSKLNVTRKVLLFQFSFLLFTIHSLTTNSNELGCSVWIQWPPPWTTTNSKRSFFVTTYHPISLNFQLYSPIKNSIGIYREVSNSQSFFCFPVPMYYRLIPNSKRFCFLLLSLSFLLLIIHFLAKPAFAEKMEYPSQINDQISVPNITRDSKVF